MQTKTIRRRSAAVALCASLVMGAQVVSTTEAVAQEGPASNLVLGVGADETSQNFSWTSRVAGDQFLRIAPVADPGASRDIAADYVDHGALLYHSYAAEVDGLQPSTTYTYQAGSDAIGWSAPVEFTTDDFDDSWNFITMSDAQIGVNLGVEEQSAQWNKATEVAFGRFPEASMMFHLGDQVEGWGDPNRQYNEFLAPDAVRTTPLAVLMGNHETYSGADRHYKERHNLPNVDVADKNYYFERNNVLFIGLNSNLSSASDIEAHANFLRTTIAEHGADNDWVIVGLHHAPFSQGSHNSDADVIALRDGLAPVYSETGVDLVLSGHDHIYTRSHLMEGTTPVEPDTLPARGDVLNPTDGQVLYVTVTTAGGGKYYDFHGSDGKAYPNQRREFVAGTDLELPSTAYWNQDYTPDFTNIDVTPTELTISTYNVNTPYIVDQVTIAKDAASEDPVDPADPVDPVDPADPVDPVDPADPVDPQDPSTGAGGSSLGGSAAGSSAGGILLVILGVIAAIGGAAASSGALQQLAAQFGLKL